MSGVWVQFEGIDGSGKTTLMECVYGRLAFEHGIRALATREPGSGHLPMTQHIRRMLKDPRNDYEVATKLHLFMADRVEHTVKVVAPALGRGELVLQDRGFMSTYAYQSGVGYHPDFIRDLNKAATRGMTPDILVYMNVPLDVAWDRIKDRQRDTFEQKEYLHAVSRAYMEELGRLPSHIEQIIFTDKDTTEKATQHVIDVIMRRMRVNACLKG